LIDDGSSGREKRKRKKEEENRCFGWIDRNNANGATYWCQGLRSGTVVSTSFSRNMLNGEKRGEKEKKGKKSR